MGVLVVVVGELIYCQVVQRIFFHGNNTDTNAECHLPFSK